MSNEHILLLLIVQIFAGNDVALLLAKNPRQSGSVTSGMVKQNNCQ